MLDKAKEIEKQDSIEEIYKEKQDNQNTYITFAANWRISPNQAKDLLESFPYQHAETAVILARSNRLDLEDTIRYYKENNMDYDLTTKAIEEAKGLKQEKKRTSNYHHKDSTFRKSSYTIDEFADPEIMETNLGISSRLKDSYSDPEIRRD